MQQLTIQNLQEYLKLKYKGRATSTDFFMKLVEEIGEVAEALNELEGRKAKKESTSLEEELADIIHYTVSIANAHDIDLAEAILRKDKTASVKYNFSPNLEEHLDKTEES